MSKYSEFQEKRESLKREVVETSDYFYQLSLLKNYDDLLGEILVQFKLLEDKLEWRKKVEAKEWGDGDFDYFESDEEREEWNEFFRRLIEKSRKPLFGSDKNTISISHNFDDPIDDFED